MTWTSSSMVEERLDHLAGRAGLDSGCGALCTVCSLVKTPALNSGARLSTTSHHVSRFIGKAADSFR
jgi:hypothetical protein